MGKSGAAKFAWWKIKQEGANTIIGVFGDTPVDILKDTGLLINSLSPGVVSAERVFRVGPGEVIVGTNRKHAARHHAGDPKRGLPQRRLWPHPSRWPQDWWGDILDVAKQGILDLIVHLVKGAGGQ
jgi:hypothetical protein